MGETLADLYRRVGLHAAWEDQPEARPGYRYPTPAQARANPETRELELRETASQRRFREQAYADTMQNELGRNEVNTPPNAYLGQDILEATGAPALSRSFDHIAAGEPGEAIPEALMGGLGILGTATLPMGGGVARAPRAPRVLNELPPPRMPANPARMPTRATDGSVLPLREPEPFRASLSGASEDLAGAARMRPDAGGVQREPSRRVYRGTQEGVDPYAPSENGWLGPGGYWTGTRQRATEYGPVISEADVTGPFVTEQQFAARMTELGGPDVPGNFARVKAEFEAQGYRGIRGASQDEYALWFDPRTDAGGVQGEPLSPEVQRIKDMMSGRSPDRANTYSFETEAGQPYQVRIEPNQDGTAHVDFGAGDNWDDALRDAQFPDRGGRSPDAVEVFNNVERILREDAAVNARPAYSVSGSYGRLKDIYTRMAQRREPPPGYVLDTSDPNTLVWRRARPDGGSARGGRRFDSIEAQYAFAHEVADAVERQGGTFGDGLQLVLKTRTAGIDSNTPVFNVMRDGKKIGIIDLNADETGLRLHPTLDAAHRRQNIGTQLYQYLERMSGQPLSRSDNLTEAGAGLWRRLDRNRAQPNAGPTLPPPRTPRGRK